MPINPNFTTTAVNTNDTWVLHNQLMEHTLATKKTTKLSATERLKAPVCETFGVIRRGGPSGHPDFLSSDALLGVEIEVENWNGIVPTGWVSKEDGSLRNKGREFTVGPARAGEMQSMLADFCRTAIQSKWQATVRTGIHVHVNMSDKDGEFLVRFVECYLAAERTLFKYAGEWRRWCNFCHPLEEANEPLLVLRQIMNGEISPHTLKEMGKYAGLNLCSLLQFGTVEIRILPTTFEYSQLVGWINAILGIYQLADKLHKEGISYIDYVKAHGVSSAVEAVFLSHKISAAEFSDVLSEQDFRKAHRHIRWLVVKTSETWDKEINLDLNALTKIDSKSVDPYDNLKQILNTGAVTLQDITAELNRVYNPKTHQSIYFFKALEGASLSDSLNALASRTGKFGPAFLKSLKNFGV